MSVFILDVVIIVAALSILFTTVQRNHRIYMRRILCSLVAFALTFGVLYYFKDKVVDFISSLGLVNYLSFIPNEIMTPVFKEVVGYGVLLLVAFILNVIFLLFAKLFSKERRKLKKDRTYSPVFNPVLSLIAGILRIVLFVYLTSLFIFICSDLFVDFDLGNSIIYPLLEENGIIIFKEELKEIALSVLG